MENVMLSIIVPVYNVERYLKRAINSITCQSFSDYEIIICNDGSTDNSGKICDELAGADDRITVIHKENGGVSSARNVAMEIAKGKYIYFFDPDDYLIGEVFKDNIAIAEENSCDQVVFSFESEICDLNDRVIKRVEYRHGLKGMRQGENFKELYLSHIQNVNNVVWNRIYTKSSIGNTRFSEEIITAEDAIFNLELVEKGVGKVCYNDKIYYSYMCRINSLMNKYNPYRFNNEMLIVDTLKKITNSWGVEKEFNKYLSMRYVEGMIFEYGNMNMRDCGLTVKEIAAKMRDYNLDERVSNAKKFVELKDISHIGCKVLYYLSNKNMFILAVCFKKIYTLLSRAVHTVLYMFNKLTLFKREISIRGSEKWKKKSVL